MAGLKLPMPVHDSAQDFMPFLPYTLFQAIFCTGLATTGLPLSGILLLEKFNEGEGALLFVFTESNREVDHSS
jgi:hypothetical protein